MSTIDSQVPYKTITYNGCNLEPKRWENAKSAEDASKITGLPVDRLLEFADRRLCPHYRVDEGPPRFNMPMLKSWITDNLVEVIRGSPLPLVTVQNVEVKDTPAAGAMAPDVIRGFPGLRNATFGSTCSGVYFLCSGNECVYVGQAVLVSARVGHHTDKEFDRAYYIPVAQKNLTEVERQLIEALVPRYNNCPLSRKLRRESECNPCDEAAKPRSHFEE